MEKNKLFRIYTQEELEREQRNEAMFDFRYIHWHTEAEKVRLDHDGYNEMSRFLKENGKEQKSPYKTRRIEWGNLTYRIDLETRKRQPAMYVSHRKEDNSGYSYIVYYTEMDGEKLERESGAGHRGYNTLNDLLRERLHISLAKAFGVLPVEDGDCWISKCVKGIKQLIWYNPVIINRKLTNTYKADIKSAWPSMLRGSLPDATTAKQVNGRVAPDAEYTFAFYVNSGHIAEYGKYDTHELRKNPWYKKSELSQKENAAIRNDTFITYDDSVADEDEITVLMRPSRINITPDITKMFWIKENADNKKTRDWYKWMLNALIGFMRSEINNKEHYQGHIAAIVYARAVNYMLALINKIVEEGSTPIYFAIDCIMWVGKPSAAVTPDKIFGAFVEEWQEAEAVVCGQGQYYAQRGDQVLAEKHQGVSKKTYTAYNIKTMDDFIEHMGKAVITKEVFDAEINEFIEVEVLK